MKNLSVENAAQIMSVSTATIRNWAKAGHLNPVSSRPILFSEESVSKLKDQLVAGSFGKLKTRANKAKSINTFTPEEYASNSILLNQVAGLVSIIRNERIETEPFLFLASLRLLEINGEVEKEVGFDPLNLDSYHAWKRRSVERAMYKWRSSFCTPKIKYDLSRLYERMELTNCDDFLGLLYQSILMEGDKSEQGSYYTPSKLVADSLSFVNTPVKTFLDPCCGSGKYLISAVRKFNLLPEDVYGFDCDSLAVNIARINLFLEFIDCEFEPKVYCLDSLSDLATGELFCETNGLCEAIDLIATNPPWGAYKNLVSKFRFAGEIKSGETYALFLEKAIQLTRECGFISFLLPESILKIKIHADIRKLILNKTAISKIALLGRQFKGVFTPVIRLDLIKRRSALGDMVSIEKKEAQDRIPQDRFMKNVDFAFDVSTESNEEELLNKIYATEHSTLKNNAEWALGIVTGDNKKYLLESNDLGCEAVYRGSDVFSYSMGEPKTFLHFAPKCFQQVANNKYYRASEKLIYKFISKKLVFAYDDKQLLTLNSANILIPSIPGISIKTTLAFLNSKLFQYIFKIKFSTHKVLRGDLEKFPFPALAAETNDKIEHYVELVIHNRMTSELLDQVIFSTFELNEDEIFHIEKIVKG